jgi:N-ethylmaleimide reductase
MTNEDSILFEPFNLKGLVLKNRIIMAPLTRSRALHGSDVPHALNTEYYAQRASAGLIISEGTQISPTGKGYAWTPGIYSQEQVAGWKLITDAVHQKGGAIYAQLWHVGRISHTSFQPNGTAPLAPSALAAVGKKTFIENGEFVDVSMPHALTLEEIAAIIDEYRKAAIKALHAGFDGVEIHGANGYLIHQFLCDGSNQRTDTYGGSIENRLRFPLEVMKGVIAAVGAHRTGIRISPVSHANGIADSDPSRLFFSFIHELSNLDIAYVHVVEGETGGSRDAQGLDFHALRHAFKGTWMVNNGYTQEMAIQNIASGYADLVSFGTLYIANPDLVERFKHNQVLNPIDKTTFYGGDAKGYTDYPTLENR